MVAVGMLDAVTKIVYGVAMSGDGLPDLTVDATSTWDQSASEAPLSAVAVFPPGDDEPDVELDDVAASDWKHASLTYMNGVGAATNTAVYGADQWLISTQEYNRDGYPSASLSAANRALALTLNPQQCDAPAVVCTQGSSSARALLLASLTAYNDPALPGVATDTYTPTFDAVVESLKQGGDTGVRSVRTHNKTVYNQGAPTGDQYAGMALPTTVTTGAKIMDGTNGADRDVRTATYGYGTPIGGTSGWTLRQATSVTQNGITSYTAFNNDGNPTQTRQPMSNGADAGTTVMSYYGAAGNPNCSVSIARPEWDGLVCASGPAAQPSGKPMPTTYKNMYTMRLQPAVVVDKSGTVTRTSITSYDAQSGRVKGTVLTSDQEGDVAVPATSTSYESAFDAVAATSAAGKDVSTDYDSWGRPVSYTDASGVTSHANYNLAGQVATLNDGQGTYTYTYDSDTEQRGMVTKETTDLGGTLSDTITVDYNANGGPSTVVYPNGVRATFGYNTAGAMTDKSYATSADEQLGAWSQQFTPFGQVENETSPLGPLTYDYDASGRLTRVADSRSGGCTVRTYTFNNNSDRVGKTSNSNGTTACPTGTGTTTSTWVNAFDTADRQTSTQINGAGVGYGTYVYDSLGRTTTIPQTDTNNRTATQVGYYANDTVASQTQGTNKKSWSIDPINRVYAMAVTADGTTTNTVTNHYAGPGDAPAWATSQDNSTKRFIIGPGGGFAITENTNPQGAVTADLNLTNLHGDVVATIPVEANVTRAKRSAFSATDEYGIALANTPTLTPYQWVGAAMRNNDTLGGLIQMGARNYNPNTGRFLSLDPVPGGNPNAYTYPVDPVNMYDPSGKWGFSDIINTVVNIVRTVVRFVSTYVAPVVYRASTFVTSVAKTAWHGVTKAASAAHKVVKAVASKLAITSNLGRRNRGLAAAGLVNVVWGYAKVDSGLTSIGAGAAAEGTFVGIPLGVAMQGYGAYNVGTGATKMGRGLNQLYLASVNSCTDCSAQGQAREFLEGTVPLYPFFTDAPLIDKLGSLF